jgi:hypothetical protein
VIEVGRGGSTNSSSPRRISRRNFLKLMAAAGVIMTFAPFVDWGKFLPNIQTNVAKRAKAELPDGTQANIKTFPVNHSEVVIYPKTDDAVLYFKYTSSLFCEKPILAIEEYR